MLLNQLKQKLFKYLTNSSSSIFGSSIPVSIVLGIGTPNGTQVSGYGNLSKTSSTNADGNTIFDIASITKTFATILLMDMLKQGLVNRSDPLEKHLPC
jgi:serine-type D-Ala-D-Ala carboxypeptidase/endopeptidase